MEDEIQECKKLIDSLQQQNNQLENTLKSYEERIEYLENQHFEEAISKSSVALKVASRNRQNLKRILSFLFLSLTLTMSLIYASENDRRVFFGKNLELISAILFGAGGIATALNPDKKEDE